MRTPPEDPNVVSWYRKHVRGVLAELSPDRIPELDAQSERIVRLIRNQQAEVSACFLGQSGIGKSTLINAIVGGDQIVLPAGGIGPLTAQALEVRYAETPRFSVEYHGKQQLWRLVFALDQRVASEKQASVDSALATDPAADAELALDDSDEAMEHLKSQARLIVCGRQNADADLAYVVDGLRKAGGWPLRWDTTLLSQDEDRVARVAEALEWSGTQNRKVFDSQEPDAAFMAELRYHAAGFLSPLIKNLELGWPSHVLRQGLRLVDLPGVGISGDAYRLVTEKWVRELARAVCLVVHRGLDSDSAGLLRTSGFLNRLLHSVDDPSADPVQLFIAVTKLDETATAHYQDERQSRPEGYRSKREHLVEAQVEMVREIRAQLAAELKAIVANTDGYVREANEQTIEGLLKGVEIFPLSAHEFTKLKRGDDDDRAFIRDAEESGVPAMQAALSNVVERRRTELSAVVNEAAASLREACRASLATLQAQWSSDDVDSPDAEKIRKELQAFITERREEFLTRRGDFRNFLKETVPEKIKSLVEESSGSAQLEMRKFSKRFREYHWATLRAVVQRGGAFVGSKHVDLPRDYALIFEGHVAPIWGEKVIRAIRQRTGQLGENYVELITEVVDWAEASGARGQARVLEALRDEIKNDAKGLATVGREMSNELREKVRDELKRALMVPIQKSCQKFVDERRHIGSGMKNRILELFDELIPTVVNAARQPATRILHNNYDVVQEEIRERLKKNPDPLKKAEEAILVGHEEVERRSRAQKRRRVLEQIETANHAMPAEQPA